MSDPKFKTGDQVKLISGGPCMTVNGVNGVRNGYQVTCVWFNNGKMESVTLLEEALRQYVQPDPGDIVFSG